jgi:hypothetical protein
MMEPFFLLGYYFGMDWDTFYNFPISYRRWLIKRINDEIKKAAEAGNDIPTKAPHHNTPDVRQLTGKTKQFQTNPRTTRFT